MISEYDVIVVGAGHAGCEAASLLRRCAPRMIDAVDYHGYGQDGADELQSGCGWHSKGRIVKGNRCSWQDLMGIISNATAATQFVINLQPFQGPAMCGFACAIRSHEVLYSTAGVSKVTPVYIYGATAFRI